MLDKDYILKLIQPFSQILPLLLNLRQSGRYEEALAVIQRTGQQLTGLDSGLLNTLSVQSLLNLLGAANPGGITQCLTLAALFAEQGEVYESQADLNRAEASYLKALDIYLHLFREHGASDLEEATPTVHELVAKLSGVALPKPTLHNLFHWCTTLGLYGRAEDMLFRLIELDAQDSDTIQEGITFYETLRRKSDAGLIAGNLPRDEVESGFQEWLAL